MQKEELRIIPKKNYFILGIILIASFLLVYYLYMWFEVYNESKLNKPILDKYMEVINYNELDNYLVESPDTIIYASVLENSEIRDFEKKFKIILKKNQLEKEVLYMDITDELKNSTIKNEMAYKYAINNLSIVNVPVILVIDNGKLRSIYEIKDNNYDIDNLKIFINNIKFSSEDELDG